MSHLFEVFEATNKAIDSLVNRYTKRKVKAIEEKIDYLRNNGMKRTANELNKKLSVYSV